MPRLSMDGREVEVPPGATILEAARRLGIEVPTLCHVEGRAPQSSCLVCVVKVNGNPNLVPSCARRAEEGMRVESETDEVRSVRRIALELLLSDHAGDCLAPCHHTCPAHMEIPQMLRQVAAGEWRAALLTVKRDIALPAVLGRICPEVCERGCRRGALDSPAAICLVKRYVADEDLASAEPYLPEKKPGRGKRVAIVGAGPAGLAAAYYLLQEGHACTLFDEHERPGGTLRYAVPEEKLPRALLDAEIAQIERLGLTFRPGTRLGRELVLSDLRGEFDAVFLAFGELREGDAERLGLSAPGLRLPVKLATLETRVPGVFAGGDLVRRRRLAVRSIADGKIAARSITRYLAGEPLEEAARPFASRAGKLDPGEVACLMSRETRAGGRVAFEAGGCGTAGGLSPGEAHVEALRCLHCDCRKKDDCRLRDYASAYGALQGRYRGSRRVLSPLLEGPDILFEAGKCIACGLCVQITRDAGEELGLTYIGRGFDVRIGVPFGRSLSEALRKTAAKCAAACPTGALALRAKVPMELHSWEE